MKIYCKCMNLGGLCPNDHYDDLPEDDLRRIEQDQEDDLLLKRVDAYVKEDIPPLGKTADTCDRNMPHDWSRDAPDGCPPYCATRLAADKDKEDKQWPPTSMETK